MLAESDKHDIPFEISPETGYVVTDINNLSVCTEVLCVCEKIYKKYATNVEVRTYASKEPADYIAESAKSFRPNILTRKDLLNYPVFLDFATHPDIVRTIVRYLGTMPVIGDIKLWWTKKNQSIQQSQLFHRDQEDYRSVKLFLSITAVEDENGPFTFVPAPMSETISRSTGSSDQKIPDQKFNGICSEDNLLTLTGPAGTLGMVDTTRCYHMGSRTRRENRVVLMIHYVPFDCVLEPICRALIDIRQSNFPDHDFPTYFDQLVLASDEFEEVWRKPASTWA